MEADENKPLWLSAPDWANFLTRDHKGNRSWFECEPYFNEVTMQYEADSGKVQTTIHGIFYRRSVESRSYGLES